MPIDELALSTALSALRGEHLERGELDASLRVVVEATQGIFGISGAGLMLIDDGEELRYVAATDGRSAAMEAAQTEASEGPCVESLLQDRVVHTRDVTDDERWPTLGAAIGGLDVSAMLGVPIHVKQTAVGSLNVYTHERRDWGDDEVQALQAFARVIEELVAQALVAQERHHVAEQLDRALTHRVVIDRAVGVLMAQHRTDAISAFHLLRDQARSSRRKVAEVASEVLDTVASTTEDDGDRGEQPR